jgi:Fur family zinc uptake transcriptional regulator
MHLEKYCRENGLRYSANKGAVYRILKAGPLTAYEILDKMKVGNVNRQPPTVYRALDFLVKHGFVLQIFSQHKYILKTLQCEHVHVEICTVCGDITQRQCCGLSSGFKVDFVCSEAYGTCQNCRKEQK